ncbi:unnamed protein product, partial [Prunus brigantina]
MAEEGLEFEYRKKFQGIEFRDMHDLINKVDRYASLLREEMQKKTASKGTYYRNPVVSYAEADGPAEAESDEVNMSSAEVNIDKPFICKGLVKVDNSRTKIPDAKFATREMKSYTFDLTRAEAIFDLLLFEKKVKLSFDHKIPKPEELKGKTFFKYHSSWSHNTNNCVVLRDVIQKLIDEKKLQFPEKTAMQVDSKPFPPPVINMVNAQLRADYREERRPAKGKEPLAEPKPVLCSRCECEIGCPRPLENKRKATEPSPQTIKRFGGQYDRRPAHGRLFDRLGAQNPSTSVSYKVGATPRPLKMFKPPVIRDDRWYHVQPGGSIQPLTKTQLRRMQRQVQQARAPTPQAEGFKRQKQMATADEPSSAPIVPTAKVASIKPPRTWRPRKDGDLLKKRAISAEPMATAPGKINEGIINVYQGRDPPFSANGLSFLREFHKDHSAVDLYGLTPENREIVELALKNTKAEGLLINRGSDSAIKAVYQANQEAKARGAPGYQPDQRKLEDKAPFGRIDLEYLRQYFSVTPTDTFFDLTTEERARARTTKAAHRAPGTARPMVEGRSDPFYGHEPEDDLPLGISNEEYEGVLGTVKERTLAGSGHGAERGADKET